MRARPTPVPTDLGPFDMVACGWCHALALNQKGDVASWGFGLKGQLGLIDRQSRKVPTLVPAPVYFDQKSSWNVGVPEWNAKLIGAASFYSMVVLQDDKVNPNPNPNPNRLTCVGI